VLLPIWLCIRLVVANYLGWRNQEPKLPLLMRYRALLFGLIGALQVAPALQPVLSGAVDRWRTSQCAPVNGPALAGYDATAKAMANRELEFSSTAGCFCRPRTAGLEFLWPTLCGPSA
jgi:hypothetical protein